MASRFCLGVAQLEVAPFQAAHTLQLSSAWCGVHLRHRGAAAPCRPNKDTIQYIQDNTIQARCVRCRKPEMLLFPLRESEQDTHGIGTSTASTACFLYLFADGAEVGVESALEAEEQLDVIVRYRLKGHVDGGHVEGDRLGDRRNK